MSEDNKKIIKDSIDRLSPTEEQSMKMWERLSEVVSENKTIDEVSEKKVVSIETVKKQKSKAGNKFVKTMIGVAASIMIIILAGIGANKVTGGKVYAAIKEWVSVFQGKQDVAGSLEESYDKNNTVYAPKIYYIDHEILIFADSRGAIVYDLAQEAVKATIDTQKIDCVYFEGDKKHSHIVMEDNRVIVFNSGENSPIGSYYCFDLNEADGGELTSYEIGEDKAELDRYYQMCQLIENNYEYTYERYIENEEVSQMFSIDSESVYSEHSINWTDETGKNCSSFILYTEGVTCLYTEVEGLDSFVVNEIDLSMASSTEQENVYLTEYIFTGDNEKIEAIYEYMRDEYTMFLDENQVCIPGYVIYKEVEEDGEYLVFGNFWAYGYQLNGSIIEAQSGYEMPACFHLKKQGGNYQVISFDRASDGSYLEDIQEFTKDYPELYDQFMTLDDAKRVESMRVYLEMYVMDNNLNIEYFSEYGEDPIKIIPD
ncbi:MAG: hypothetical protein E7258_01270 [Lachnospiraceae bacterium]|nr:hypothetical protein [Lachnospiraceae bacterium]